MPGALALFAAARGADLRWSLVRGELPSPSEPVLFESGGLWRVHAAGARRLFLFHDGGQPQPPASRAALVTPDWCEGTLFVAPGRPGPDLDYPITELAFSHHLAHSDAFLLHAAALVVDGRALVVFGHSGAGKSTTTALWRRHTRGTRVLSDDRVVVRLRRGLAWAWGTPWHGSGRYASPEAAPIAALVLLEHAAETSLEPIAAPLAAAEVFARAFPPIWDASAVSRVLAAVDAVTNATPVYRLKFLPDAESVRAVRHLLSTLPGPRAAR